MRSEESYRLIGLDGRENLGNKGLHDALVAFMRTIDVEKLKSGPLRRHCAAASCVVDQAAIDKMLAPTVGIEGL